MVAAPILWSSAGVVTRHIQQAAAVEQVFWRSLFAFVFVFLILSLQKANPWRAVRAAQTCDARGNAVVGNASLREAVDNLIVTDGTKVAVIGVTGLAVVATARGVLVAPLERAAEIKAMLGE